MTKNTLLLTILVPAYNAENFLSISLPSILNERIFEEKLMKNFEVIIVDDGSTDNTYKDAKVYAKKWNIKTGNKSFVRVLTKKNGQYGSTINLALTKANGHYFKVLDVDDHFNVQDFMDYLYILKGIKKDIDVVITDFIYEKVGTNKTYKWSFNKVFNNSETIDIFAQKFPRELITMHCITYRLNLLKDNNYKQIENVYYSDSQYSLVPLQFAKKYYYTNTYVYGYYIGRDDQSINIKVMIRNAQHQKEVMEQILQDVKFDNVSSKYIEQYLILNLRAMIQWRIMLIAKDEKIIKKRAEIFKVINFVKKSQPIYYKKILNSILFKIIYITRGIGVSPLVRISITIYNKFRNNIFDE